MASFELLTVLLKQYAKPQYLVSALRNPRLAWGFFKGPVSDYANIEALLGIQLEKYIGEINSNVAFNEGVWRQVNHLEGWLKPIGPIRKDMAMLLYALVRALRPDLVLETGVGAGVSSTYILCALEENRQGRLFSIDLPYLDANGQTTEPGWAIPDELKFRWRLDSGKSHEKLPPALEELKSVDIFFHDSEHSYSNMKWEFETIWPYLRQGGILLADDVYANNAFFEFCKSLRARPALYGRRLGLIVKGQG